MQIIITENFKNKKIPAELIGNKNELNKYFSAGKVTVLRWHKLTDNDLIPFYSPRIRGFNFKSPLYSTAEKAYKRGMRLKKLFNIRVLQHTTAT